VSSDPLPPRTRPAAGEQGYWPAPDIDPEKFNRDIGATPAQLRAMEIGSMFGFDVPGSFVENHKEKP